MSVLAIFFFIYLSTMHLQFGRRSMFKKKKPARDHCEPFTVLLEAIHSLLGKKNYIHRGCAFCIS